jgi:hypothetical protein
MDFDQMLATWRTQQDAAAYSVNEDALRQMLQAEEAKVQRELRTRRRGLWVTWIVGTGLAVFAAFWIAICIANGWPGVYVFTSALSFAVFAFGIVAMWRIRGRPLDPKPEFGNTMQHEVRRNLALVEHQLSLTRYWPLSFLGAVAFVAGAFLFSWTLNRSQQIAASHTGLWWQILIGIYLVWALNGSRAAMRRLKPKLQARQRQLQEVLAALDGRE